MVSEVEDFWKPSACPSFVGPATVCLLCSEQELDSRSHGGAICLAGYDQAHNGPGRLGRGTRTDPLHGTRRSSSSFLQSKSPRHLISDQGPLLNCDGYRKWCKRKNIKPRFGAVGNYGSIAIIWLPTTRWGRHAVSSTAASAGHSRTLVSVQVYATGPYGLNRAQRSRWGRPHKRPAFVWLYR